jgi:hypothetical protein
VTVPSPNNGNQCAGGGLAAVRALVPGWAAALLMRLAPRYWFRPPVHDRQQQSVRCR